MTNESQGIPTIDVREAERRLREDPARPLLVDVREPVEFAEVRAPGAFLVPTSSFMARQADLPTDRPLLVICHLRKNRLALESDASAAGYSAAFSRPKPPKGWRTTTGNQSKRYGVRRDYAGPFNQVKLPGGYYKAFVELHIEQGPVLRTSQIPLGVVAKIAAPASVRVSIEGTGGHAGGVLMTDRRDALCAAAELILAIENAARTSGTADTVATVGICEVFPGAINSIPSRVRLTADIRDTDLAQRDGVVKAMENACNAISARRRVAILPQLLNADAPAECAPTVVEVLSDACRKYGQKFLPMISRAYHDSLFMARIAPVAMLFIPCRNGYSHRPDEYASPEDVARGALVLAEALATLSA